MKWQFDDHDSEPGYVILKDNAVEIHTRYAIIRIVEASPDQWGTFYRTTDGTVVCQEYGTRSFLDALIKALTELRECCESTKDAEEVA